jgi:putative IMPACT (imprinted ancient) family translation regulator
MKKVKIGTISNKVENREERKETLERIEEERKYQTDVCTSTQVFFSTTDVLSDRHALSAL